MKVEQKKEVTLILEDVNLKDESKVSTASGVCGGKANQTVLKPPIDNTGKDSKRDYFGNIIDKTNKEQHISFRDVVTGKELTDIKEVESYKVYNAMDGEVVEEPIQPKCECVLF